MVLNSDQWHVLYTLRTVTLPEHSGQVAFPGGRADSEQESSEVTALREAEEEINLKPQDVSILGRLNAIRTISNYMVTPVIGSIPPSYEFELAPDEVSRIFTIPLIWLSDPNNHEIRMRELPIPFPSVPVIYFRSYEGELLWGVSAEITLNLLETLHLFQVSR
jgi:8-oxo-dGTP pyrophosphatase MutT (NUDIX family)